MDKHQQTNTSDDNAPGWEKAVLEKLAFAAIDEQKRTRRWGVFFKFLTFAYLAVALGMFIYPRFEAEMTTDKEHVAVIDVLGMIVDGEAANADVIIEGLRDAEKDKNTKGIILNINSPGGSAVQSAYVYEEIRRQKAKHPDIPIYSVVGDMCASGGYYIASASDKIYVSRASLIGSIGVIMNGFGFSDVLHKLGVERRLLTAGEHKAMLDPFSPINLQEEQHMQSLLDQVHQQFIAAVKQGRGDRLKETPEMFSGLVWTGEEGVKLGLADDFGSVDSVARDVLGTETKVNFTPQERLIDRLAGKFGASFAHAMGTAIKSINFQ
ncbi:signal peptide peptidase SppA [Methylomonas methanica]|uniref:Signal peptide peptidase SppA, 36K type n=1 Tax=Methylomonas methanica (strain DSM 25384 / MC09) TaxID=857087 RepID=G0A4I5_METMM|nr:signal peptide peptidase SppA [Methylomonas methanica]AEG01576.1 signal peptide peptidase SppA, 36K type [Methylomonas methanica MC09]